MTRLFSADWYASSTSTIIGPNTSKKDSKQILKLFQYRLPVNLIAEAMCMPYHRVYKCIKDLKAIPFVPSEIRTNLVDITKHISHINIKDTAMPKTYTTRAKLTDEDLREITIMYQFRIPTKTIGIAFDLGYQKANQIINIIKITNNQLTPRAIREVLTNK